MLEIYLTLLVLALVTGVLFGLDRYRERHAHR